MDQIKERTDLDDASIMKLLNGFEFRARFNEQIEELYLSGCISLQEEREFFRITARPSCYCKGCSMMDR